MALPRSKKCVYCGERLRSKHNIMHRKCERELYDPPAPPKPQRPAFEWPASKWCPSCKRLHNGMVVPRVCACGTPTETVPEDVSPRQRHTWKR